jgi:hypothetical protein
MQMSQKIINSFKGIFGGFFKRQIVPILEINLFCFGFPTTKAAKPSSGKCGLIKINHYLMVQSSEEDPRQNNRSMNYYSDG